MSPPKELIRLFVHIITPEHGPRKGIPNRVVLREVHTNVTQTDLAKLHMLTRKGLISYEDDPLTMQVFGVRGWIVKLTDKGHALLEAPLSLEAFGARRDVLAPYDAEVRFRQRNMAVAEAKARGIEVVAMDEDGARDFVVRILGVDWKKIDRVEVVGAPPDPSRHKEGAMTYAVHLSK